MSHQGRCGGGLQEAVYREAGERTREGGQCHYCQVLFNHPGHPDIDPDAYHPEYDRDDLLRLRNLIALVSGCSLGELTSMEKLVSELFASKDITKVQTTG